MPINYGFSQHDGYKTPTEDYVAHKVYTNGYELFAVFDGHSTDFFAKQAAYILPEILVNQFEKTHRPEDIKTILELAFQETDKILEDGPIYGGTTATVTIITDTHIIIASVGDSIALHMDLSGNLLNATEDDNTENINECDRIRAAGGEIINDKYNDPRVQGTLVLTRSIGDATYKKFGVIPTPQIIITERKPGYLVLMSDSFVECNTYSFLFDTFIKHNYNRSDLATYTYSFIEKTDLTYSAKQIVLHQVNKFRDKLTGYFYGDNTSLIYIEL
jgi:serine/threonine protein phosphatase PrpC